MVNLALLNKRNALFLILLFFITSGCGYLIMDERLTIEKQSYHGKNLRLDGFFYWTNKHDNKSFVLFLYQDGTARNLGGGWSTDDFTPLKWHLDSIDSRGTSQFMTSRLRWGVFSIKGDSIAIERWYPSSGGPCPVYRDEGLILNDTTFVLTKSVHPRGKRPVREINYVYHFKQFSPKPDSANTYVK